MRNQDITQQIYERVVGLNRAVAVAMRDGPEAGLKQVEALLAKGELDNYPLAHSRGPSCAAGWVESSKPGPPLSRRWP